MSKKAAKSKRKYPVMLRQEVWDQLDGILVRRPEMHMSQLFDQAMDLFMLHVEVWGYDGVLRELEFKARLLDAAGQMLQ
jgi:hypothetical protein